MGDYLSGLMPWNWNNNSLSFDTSGPPIDLADPNNLAAVGNIQGLKDYSSMQGFGQPGGFATGLSGVGNIMGGLAGLAGAYTGLQQLGLAEDQFDFTKGLTNRNLFNQAQITNAQMKDRQKARHGSTGTISNSPYVATNKYMDRNSVDGSKIG